MDRNPGEIWEGPEQLTVEFNTKRMDSQVKIYEVEFTVLVGCKE